MISNEPQTLAHDPEAIIDQYILEANNHPVRITERNLRRPIV